MDCRSSEYRDGYDYSVKDCVNMGGGGSVLNILNIQTFFYHLENVGFYMLIKCTSILSPYRMPRVTL